jgi:hypothetical protein
VTQIVCVCVCVIVCGYVRGLSLSQNQSSLSLPKSVYRSFIHLICVVQRVFLVYVCAGRWMRGPPDA